MDQTVAKSTFKDVPDAVIAACEIIRANYLAEMLSRYNEIGTDSFDDVDVLKYGIKHCPGKMHY